MFSTPKQSPLLHFLKNPLNPSQSRLEPELFLKPRGASADVGFVEQKTLDELGFSLDLAHMCTGTGFHDSSVRSASPEVEELEAMVQAVIAYADLD